MGEGGVTRRVVLRDGSAMAVAVMLSGPASGLADIAVPVRQGRPRFLNQAEMAALRGLVDQFIPADDDPGGLAAGCAEAIDALLGAFKTDPPRIYAGAPFSDRGGSKVNHFKRFLRLDPYEEMGWRLRIQGSRGRKALEFNGPVTGWQKTYREGLAALDSEAGGSFGEISTVQRELILRTTGDERIADLVDVAWPHTYQFMYGAPEYGGNKDLIGWRYTDYDGDVQPRGYTREQIEQLDSPDDPGREVRGLKTPFATLAALAPLAGGEAAQHIIAAADGSNAALEREIDAILAWAKTRGTLGA